MRDSQRHAPAFHGVDGAGNHENDAVAQTADEREVRHVTLQDPAGQLRVGGVLLLVVDGGVGGHHREPYKHTHTHTDEIGRASCRERVSSPV